jgi:hypothetical protein
VHRPPMICVFDPVCPHQPAEEAQQESHFATSSSSQPLRYSTVAVRQCGGLKDRSHSTRRTLGKNGLGRGRKAQPVRVANSSTQTETRPNMKCLSLWGGLCCGEVLRTAFPPSAGCHRIFVEGPSEWPACATQVSTLGLFESSGTLWEWAVRNPTRTEARLVK